jgi:hypothetical protein
MTTRMRRGDEEREQTWTERAPSGHCSHRATDDSGGSGGGDAAPLRVGAHSCSDRLAPFSSHPPPPTLPTPPHSLRHLFIRVHPPRLAFAASHPTPPTRSSAAASSRHVASRRLASPRLASPCLDSARSSQR